MLKKLDFRKTHRVFTPATLIQILDKNVAAVQKYSKMAINTKVNGTKTKPTAKANFGTKTVISTRDIGKTERPKAMDFTKLKVVAVTSETGITIYNMGLVKKRGQMDRIMKENITRALNKVKVSTNTWMVLSMKEIGIRTKYKVLVLTLGQMKKFTPASGKTITCMDKASSAGQTEDNTKVNTQTIRKKASESILGPTGANTLDNGKTASNMAREYIKMLTI